MIDEMLPKNGVSFTDALLLGGIDAVKVAVGLLSFAVARKYRLSKHPFPDKAFEWFCLACTALVAPLILWILLSVTGILYLVCLGDGGFIQIYTLMAICALWGTFAIKHDEILGYIHKNKSQSEPDY
jgi:hypothetical protein